LPEFYNTAGRLASEHALLDDNAMSLARRRLFRGNRAVRRRKGSASVDGAFSREEFRPHRASRNETGRRPSCQRVQLELAIARLREAKGQIGSRNDYYSKLEKLLGRTARLYGTAQAGTFETVRCNSRVTAGEGNA